MLIKGIYEKPIANITLNDEVSTEYFLPQIRNCGRINNGFPKIPDPISRICEHVTLHGKKKFADVIKLRILR